MNEFERQEELCVKEGFGEFDGFLRYYMIK